MNIENRPTHTTITGISGHTHCAIVPPYLLERLAALDEPGFRRAAAAARHSLVRRTVHSRPAGVREDAASSLTTPRPTTRGELVRAVFDAQSTEELPGTRVRGEGDPATGDAATDEAYDGLGATHALFAAAFDRDSIDDAGLPLEATVHFGEAYDNAFWDGSRMVFGDGDGEVFERFTRSLSVIGHELSHGVVQYSANFVYEGQSGALNESVADVFGALVEQYAAGESADEASWLIGVGLFTDEVEGDAIRSLAEPGSAYDDDVLGADPQPGHMRDYIETVEDNGGVHLNSGIPNKAFHLAATVIGGFAWEQAGRIWYHALTLGTLTATATFAEFAAQTIRSAEALFGADSDERSAVVAAWNGVGVTPDGAEPADDGDGTLPRF
ncbi:M4 family metallopeptidase [Labedella endophytica]|uniref:Neutral metalloproteinase n=1 Tax=Labedella endophytica TaxID=1523160 RepID=A0A433JST3_9MICO|nr:M4 family metallopeptidase [Labedella endophytica]RUR01097.1 M4 family peptidase [Labedella endophytica]